MEKFKKRVAAILVIGMIAFVAGFALLAQNLSPVNRVFAEGNVASLSINGTITEYATVVDALDAVPAESDVETTVLTILQNTEYDMPDMDNKKFTFDFKGHAVRANGASTIGNSTIIFDDSSTDKNGSLTINNTTSFKGSTITFKAGTFAGVDSGVYDFVSGSKEVTLIVDGGIVTGSLNLHGANFIMKSGSVKTANCRNSANVDISGGKIDALTVGGNLYGSNKSVSISGGEIKALTVGSNYSYRIILASGKAYKSADGFVKIADMNSSTAVEITDGCPHDSVTGSECDYCNTALAAKAKTNGETTEKGYEELEAAIAAVGGTGATENVITLLGECDNVSIGMSDKCFTLDFNGYKVTTRAKVAADVANSTIIFDDFSDEKNGGFVVNDTTIGFPKSTIICKAGTVENDNNGNGSYHFGAGIAVENSLIIDGGIVTGNIVFGGANFTMKSGSIKTANCRYSSKVDISGGKIDSLTVGSNPVSISGGEIKSLSVVGGNSYKSILASGKAYKSADGKFIKLSEINENTVVTIADCEHAYTDGVCDYCDLVCEHKNDAGEYIFDENGKCTVCGMLCPHDHVTDLVCEDCGFEIIACVERGGVIKYYSDIFVAISALSDGDTLRLLRNVADLVAAPTINKNFSLELNGKSTGNVAWYIEADVNFSDLAGGGKMAIICRNGNIVVDNVKAETEITITVASDSAKAAIYGGRLKSVTFEPDCGTLRDLLPNGYAFKNESGEPLKYADCNVTLYGGGAGRWLTTEQCSHSDDFDSDFKCFYCGKAFSAEEAITLIKKQLKTAQDNLKTAQEDLAKKANSSDVEEELKKVNAAIKAVEDRATALETALGLLDGRVGANEKAIKALQEADKTINEAIKTINDTIDGLRKELELTKSDLEAAIAKKADAETVNAKLGLLNEAVKKLENAIGTAEDASNGYADKLDAAIRKDIETLKSNIAADILKAKEDAIATAEKALISAKNELNDKMLEKADKSELLGAVDRFNSALANAESVSKNYSDEQIEGLRAELKAEIAKAKGELSATIDELLERLDAAEKNIDGNSKQISALKATVITAVSLFFAIDVLFAVLFFVFKRRAQ